MFRSNTILQIFFVGLALLFASFMGAIIMGLTMDEYPLLSKEWLIELLKGAFWGFFWGLLIAPFSIYKINRKQIIYWIIFFIVGISAEMVLAVLILLGVE